MTNTYRDVLDLPKESFYIQVEDILNDLATDTLDYLNRNKNHLSRNQMWDAQNVYFHIRKAMKYSERIRTSVRKPRFSYIDTETNLIDKDIPF